MSFKKGCFFLLLGGASVLIFLATSYVISQLIAQRNKMVMLVVAKHDYPKGTTIKDPEQMFELRAILDRDAPGDRVFDLEELRNQTLTSDIREGQPIQYLFFEGTTQPTKQPTNKVELDPPGPGRKHLAIAQVKARKESIQVGTRVDVIYSKSQGPKAETILLHDVVVRFVEPAYWAQGRLDKQGKTGMVALAVILDTSLEEAEAFEDSVERSLDTFVEVRPRNDNKKVGEKNSTKDS